MKQVDSKEAVESFLLKAHEILKDETETALDNYTNYEYTIINDGSLEDLNNKVKQIVDEVI